MFSVQLYLDLDSDLDPIQSTFSHFDAFDVFTNRTSTNDI